METHLYLKTHNKTGLKYLGKTDKQDPSKYRGSGSYWKRHLRKHGNDVTTHILRKCKEYGELQYWGYYYSNLWNVVESNEFANLKPEVGEGGPLSEQTKKKIGRRSGASRKGKFYPHMDRTGSKHTEEWKLKSLEWKRGNRSRTGQKQSEEEKLLKSLALKGKPKPPRTKEHSQNISRANKGKKKPKRTPEHQQKLWASRRQKQQEGNI